MPIWLRTIPGVAETMTRPYEWRPIPHCVDIVCPVCRQRAAFEFAEVSKIALRSDIPFFRENRLFEYTQFTDSCGHTWHAAVYFEGLHGPPQRTLADLPDGYSAEDWKHPRYLRSRDEWPVGSFQCNHCHTRRMHRLHWPQEAFYSISYRHHVLWAFHRESAVDLMHYLDSPERNRSPYRWSSFLLYVPTVFKVRKARESVVKQLHDLLDPGRRRQRTR